MAAIRKTMKLCRGRGGTGQHRKDKDATKLSTSRFKNMKYVDGLDRIEKQQQHCNNDEQKYHCRIMNKHPSLRKLLSFTSRLTPEERLERRERRQEDELNRSEHDELSRPWRQYNTRRKSNNERSCYRSSSSSFRKVKFIDEKDHVHHHERVLLQASSYHSCGGLVGRPGTGTSVNRHRHETMLEVMKRLHEQEEIAEQETRKMNCIESMNLPLQQDQEEDSSPDQRQDSCSMLQHNVMKTLITEGPESTKQTVLKQSLAAPSSHAFIVSNSKTCSHRPPITLMTCDSSSKENDTTKQQQPVIVVRKGYTAMSA